MKNIKLGQLQTYFKYAIGEILLVVIGILIALYIRGEYDEKKQNIKIEKAALQVVNDLRKDTADIASILNFGEPYESLYLRVIGDSMDLEDYKECDRCPYLCSNLMPFVPTQDGYIIMKNFETDLISPRDSLFYKTKQFYSTGIPMMELLVDLLKEDVSSNLRDWRDHEVWYAEWVEGKRPESLYDYMLENPKYRNKVANIYMLLYKNYYVALRNYREEAIQIADQWEILINKEQ